MEDEPCRQAVAVGERFADGNVSDQERHQARTAARRAAGATWGLKARLGNGAAEVLRSPRVWAPENAVNLALTRHKKEERAQHLAGRQLELLRDVLANPFRPLPSVHSFLFWSDGVVVRLAQAAYDERILPRGLLDPTRLAVLADALEEAGCIDQEILHHLRSPGPHVRGCFVVDHLLGKG
jgi:hypothetical protein